MKRLVRLYEALLAEVQDGFHGRQIGDVLSRIAGGARRTQIIRRATQAWLLLVIVGSLQPSRPGQLLILHREIHWVAFAGAAFLVLLATRTRAQATQRVIWVWLIGVLLETLQHFLYHRTIEWLDVGDDACAVLLGLAIYWLIFRRSSLKSVNS